MQAWHCKGKALSLSPWSIILAVGFLNTFFINLIKLPSIPTFLSFHHEWILNFDKCFFWVNWYNHVNFLLLQINMADYTDWFLILASFPEMNSTWSWHVTLFIYYLILSANILVRISPSICTNDIGFIIGFFLF